MNGTLFTIITPVRNAARSIEKTVQSVLTQDPSLFEYLVQDGASTDATLSIVQSYASQLTYVSEPDTGVYDAMNRALTRAQGQFVYFLGAGDTLKPGILTQIAAVLEKETQKHAGNKQPLVLYGNVFSEGHGRVYNGPYTRWKLSRINLCHQAMWVQRECFDSLGPFDTRFPIMADYAWNIRAFGSNRVRTVYTPLVMADFAAGGLSIQRPDPAFIEARLELIKDNLGIGPYIFNKAAALVPPDLKEARYQAWQRLRRAFGLRVKH